MSIARQNKWEEKVPSSSWKYHKTQLPGGLRHEAYKEAITKKHIPQTSFQKTLKMIANLIADTKNIDKA